MIRAASFLALLLAVVTTACEGQQPAADPFAALRSGEYDGAIAGLERMAAAAPADTRARRALVRALMDVGRYDDAIDAARGAPAEQRPAMATTLGLALRARGRLDAADSAFAAAVAGRADDALTARYERARLLWERGQRDDALNAFDTFIDAYNDGPQLSSDDLVAVGNAVRFLGVRDPQLFHDALRAYEEAIAADNTNDDARLRLADLFLEKYNSTDAQAIIREVLAVNPRHPRALLLLARAKYFDGTDEAPVLAAQALEVNPNLVDARAFSARLALDVEDYDSARAEVARALDVDPSAREPLALAAAIEWLLGDTGAYDRAKARALERSPADPEFFTTVAELGVRQRKYRGAVELLKEAVAADPGAWYAWGQLGLNRMRLGEIDEARADLEVSFEGDPFNVWVKNTLDLLDTFGQYVTVDSRRFQFMLHGDEAGVLEPYMRAVAEAAYDSLSRRYGYEPETPVRVEVYPSHADFSVRTVGLAGLGALGVAFGTTLAMDSPAARERGEFNWASTLWHEIAHVVTLGMTRHRVPRWLTEGLSVREERRALSGIGWGDDINPGFVGAYRAGQTLPVSRLNEGFVRPKSPRQIFDSYLQASLVVEMIEERWGWDAILDMLRGYRDGKDDARVFRDVLRMEPEALDEAFDTWFRARYATQLRAVTGLDPQADADAPPAGAAAILAGELASALQESARALASADTSAAIAALNRAKAAFPEFAGPQSPYRALAAIHAARGDTRAAEAELSQHAARNENDYDALMELAALRESLGDAAGAADALELAMFISPYELAPHERLAALYAQTEQWDRAVREREVIVGLAPVDMAEALYQLALAQLEAGRRDDARSTILRALETAPGFEKAQELLLRIREGR